MTHIRSVRFVKEGYEVIRNRLLAAGVHRYDLRFHFAPDAGASLQIVIFGPGSRHLSTEHVSRCYGARELTPVEELTRTP